MENATNTKLQQNFQFSLTDQAEKNLDSIKELENNGNNSSTYADMSIEGISFIEKAEHNINDLEDSINQCILLLTKKNKEETVDPLVKKFGALSKKLQNSLKNSAHKLNRLALLNMSTESNNNLSIIRSTSTKQKLAEKKQAQKKTKKNLNRSCIKLHSKNEDIIPILKSSNKRMNEMRNELTNMLENKDIIIQEIDNINKRNSSKLYKNINDAQIDFEGKLEKLYKEKMEQIDLINKEYNDEIYKYQYLNKMENKNSENNYTKDNYKSITQKIYEDLIYEKENKIKEVENKFKTKKKFLFSSFKKANENYQDFSKEDRCLIYKAELMDKLKSKINEVISPDKGKKVSFNEQPLIQEDNINKDQNKVKTKGKIKFDD